MRAALVTGGASGIGRAVVERLLVDGLGVVVADYNEDNGAATVAELAEAGFDDRVAFMRTDVSDEDQVAAVVAATREHFDRLDVVVNNAGVSGAKRALDYTDADWDWVVNTDLKGAWVVAQESARRMAAAQVRGSIINITIPAVMVTTLDTTSRTVAH